MQNPAVRNGGRARAGRNEIKTLIKASKRRSCVEMKWVRLTSWCRLSPTEEGQPLCCSLGKAMPMSTPRAHQKHMERDRHKKALPHHRDACIMID